jgi:streptogramin lyase
VTFIVVASLLFLGDLALQPTTELVWNNYTTADGLVSRHVTSLAVAPSGRVWIGTLQGISYFNDPLIWIQHMKDELWSVNQHINAISVAPDGMVWFGTAYGIYGLKDGNWAVSYTAEDGLVSNNIQSIALTRDGTMWVGTDRGVSSFDRKTWTSYTEADGLVSDDVRSIAVTSDNTIWFGTSRGVSSFDGQTWVTYAEEDGLGNSLIYAIAEIPGGQLLAGTNRGISRFDGEHWSTPSASGLPSSDVRAIATDSEGAVWFGTTGGVVRLAQQAWTAYPYADELDLPGDSLQALAVDNQGQVWVGTASNGVRVLTERVTPTEAVTQAWTGIRSLGIAALCIMLAIQAVSQVRQRAKPAKPASSAPPPHLEAEWEQVQKTARRVYQWLLLSPFVTVPCFVYQGFDLFWYRGSTLGERVWAAVVPLVFHIPLFLLSFAHPRHFVKRHLQQAALLIGLRACMAAISLNLTRYPEDGLWLFLLGNGALWWFGSRWGMRQVKRGDCWLMRKLGEEDRLPNLQALPAPAAPAPVTIAAAVRAGGSATYSSPEPSADPAASFERGMDLLRGGKQVEAGAMFLAAFRSGPPELRRRALLELERLGHVEEF